MLPKLYWKCIEAWIFLHSQGSGHQGKYLWVLSSCNQDLAQHAASLDPYDLEPHVPYRVRIVADIKIQGWRVLDGTRFFTVVFTGKYRPGKNRFWTPKMGKTGKNTT